MIGDPWHRLQIRMAYNLQPRLKGFQTIQLKVHLTGLVKYKC